MKINSKIIYKSLLGFSAVMLISGWRMGYSDSAEYIAKDSVTIAKVESGNFSVKVEGYGSLQSVNKRLLTATSNAVVEEIKLKAGAIVQADTLILTLKNPALEGKLRQALAKLQNSKTRKRQAQLMQQRELLDNESAIFAIEAELEIAMLQVEAERSLAKSGIITGITAKQNELKAKQLRQRVLLEKNKLSKLVSMQKEALAIEDDLITQSLDEFNVAKLMVEQLSVKAGMSGVIQRLPLNLGQSVAVGTELALIGSMSPLVAEIKVPQMQANMVASGMNADISTLNGQVKGLVTRIDPVVNDGAVQVDIEITATIDAGIKPMQLVDATIFAKVEQGVHYMKMPAGVNENDTAWLYRLTQDNRAELVEVKFGKVSGQLIQVISGLEVGDEVVSSKLNFSKDTKKIKFTG
jgi:HlyD family secretion protein